MRSAQAQQLARAAPYRRDTKSRPPDPSCQIGLRNQKSSLQDQDPGTFRTNVLTPTMKITGSTVPDRGYDH